ncbi:DUF11 domain-containing protein, partial [Candidatus Bipolaricaulota bacterium]|nr:DUF11 domain-containing protein [Candidatus Bipolaricaulota bacterium]
ATVSSNELPDESDSAAVQISVGPNYTITKTVTDVGGEGPTGTVDAAGDVISYEITVENTGNVSLTGVSVSDPLLNPLSGPTGDDGNSILDVGETWIYTGSYTVQQSDIDSNGGGDGDIDNTATVSSNELPDESDSAAVQLLQTPGIDIEKSTNGQDADTAPGPSLTVGSPITWSYVVTNTGNVTLTDIVVTDSVLGAVGTIASLAPGVSQTLTMNGTAAAGQYVNTGTATVNYGGKEYTDSDDSHYFGAGADLSLTKSVDNAEPQEGDTIVYTITLTNGGPSTATGVQVTDALPAGLTYVSDNGGGAYDSGTGVWSVASLASGSSMSLAISATVDVGTAGSTLTNTAEVTVAGQPDPDSTPNNHDPDEDDQSSIDLTVQS